MAGWLTDGMITPTVANGGLPIPATALIPVDIPLAGGAPPQTVACTPSQIAAAGSGAAVPLTDGATIALDASLGNFFSVTLAGNRTVAIANMVGGQTVQIKVTQDGTGSRTLTITAGSGGATLVSGTPLSTAAGSVDIVAIRNVGTTAAPQYAYYSVVKALA